MKWVHRLDTVVGGLLLFNAAVVAHFLYEHDAAPYMYLMLFNTFLLGQFAGDQLNKYLRRRYPAHYIDRDRKP